MCKINGKWEAANEESFTREKFWWVFLISLLRSILQWKTKTWGCSDLALFSVQLVRSRIFTFGVSSPQKSYQSTPKIEIKVLEYEKFIKVKKYWKLLRISFLNFFNNKKLSFSYYFAWLPQKVFLCDLISGCNQLFCCKKLWWDLKVTAWRALFAVNVLK